MTSGLRSWDRWRRRYNSPPDDLLREFYEPAFRRAVTYDRAVGFFSSRLLAEIAPLIDCFVIRGGRMRILTSPANLSEADLHAIGEGDALRNALCRDLVDALCQRIPESYLVHRLKLLTWMVANDHLQVRIALRRLSDGYALFHEKIGIFSDVSGDWITFSGSPNETVSALRRHSESFPLFQSWGSEDQLKYATEERDRFRALWAGEVDGVITWSASEWMVEPMRATYGEREPSKNENDWQATLESRIAEPDSSASYYIEKFSLLPSIPAGLVLRDYQKAAVNDWLAAGGRGIFAMATGTGKTLTALAAATQLSLQIAKHTNSLLVLIVVPLIDLVYQWKKEAERFGFRPAVCHGSLDSAERANLKSVFSATRSIRAERAEMIITTAATLAKTASGEEGDDLLRSQLRRIRSRILVIGDEVHSLGTASRLDSLPVQAEFRLGLSATPKRHGDELGTAQIFAYFGSTIVSISIRDAIYKLGALVEYDYHVIHVELTPQETKQYRAISARIAAAIAAGDDDRKEREIRKRVRLVQHAEGKLSALCALMDSGLKYRSHQIIYLAEGRSPESDIKQLEEVHAVLRNEYDMKVGKYFGEVDTKQRRTLLDEFTRGHIQALLAMKCLDEGVDIPSARIGVVLSSSQNPKQFIQRRGRLLRKDPNSPKPRAEIYDFLVLPTHGSDLSESEKRLLGTELSRAAELADACRNREVLYDIIGWAAEVGLDNDIYTWMKIGASQEMENWTDDRPRRQQ